MRANRQSATRIFCGGMALILVLSTTVSTASRVFIGSVRSSGLVLVNATQLPDGGTVRSGDRITTQSGGLAVITSPVYGRLEVRPASDIRLMDDRVHLERGAAASGRLAIETAGYTIQSRDGGRSWFAVARRGGRIIVAAHRGNVLVASTDEPPVVVPEGSFAQQDSAQDEQQEEQQPRRPRKQQKRKRRTAGAAAATGGWTIGGLSHSASVALVVGMGASAAAASVGAAVMLNEENPSPSR